MWGRWSACVEASGFLGCQGCKINTQVQRLFLKRPPAAPTRQRHVPGHTPCSRWVHRPGPQGCRTACFQPPAGVGGQPHGDQGPRSPRTRASGLLPARGLEPGLHKKCFLGRTPAWSASQKPPFLTMWPSQSLVSETGGQTEPPQTRESRPHTRPRLSPPHSCLLSFQKETWWSGLGLQPPRAGPQGDGVH